MWTAKKNEKTSVLEESKVVYLQRGRLREYHSSDMEFHYKFVCSLCRHTLFVWYQ